MFVISVCLILGLIACYQFSLPYFKARKKISEVSLTGFSSIDFSNKVLIYYGLGFILSFGLLIFFVLDIATFGNRDSGIGVSLLLTLALLGKMLAARVFHRFYYSQESVIYIDKMYRIKSIKGVLPIKRSMNKIRLSFYDGTSITFPPRLGKELLAIIELSKKK